jgi:endonuclease YncB( thermonuclease family)
MQQFARAAGSFVLAIGLSACGGGGGGGDSGSAAAPTSSPTPSSAPLVAPAVPVSTYCGYSVGASLLSGTVISVHDGDTVKVSTATGVRDIRLEGIDAPELVQPYGPQSQANLSALVLNQPVTVAYSKLDQYNRVVGSVFTSSCQLTNLMQLQVGAAWFYKAYQCEQAAPVRSLYAEAQTTASERRVGLWAATDPEAPWFFRNGNEPATPTCTSDLPEVGDTAQSAPVPTVTKPPVGPTPTTPTVIPTTTPKICYVGPRGGTYTLSANGSKNYGGC